jgi:hypothetical protein
MEDYSFGETGGISMGGYPLGGAAPNKGLANYAKVLKKLEKVSTQPRKAYSALKQNGHTLDSLMKMSNTQLQMVVGKKQPAKKEYAHKPTKATKNSRSPPGLYLAERVKSLPDKEKVELAKWLHKRGYGIEGAGFWDTLGDIASTVAPFVPLLL